MYSQRDGHARVRRTDEKTNDEKRFQVNDDQEVNWEDVLSLGEKQRLAVGCE